MDDILSNYHWVCVKHYCKGKRPYPQDYRPEMDITNELDADSTNRYQNFVGKLIGQFN